MRKLRQVLGAFTASMLLVAGLPLTVGAAPGDYSLFGEASYVSPGNASDRAVKTVSDSDPGYGGIDYDIPTDLAFANLNTLSTDYNFEADDSCAVGSPRFQVNLDTDGDGDTEGNVFVYVGPAPNYTGCTTGWQNTGNLVDDTDLIDTSQVGGTFYETVATAQTRLANATITGVQLVTDGGYAFPDSEQAVSFDNTVINELTVTYEKRIPTNKNQCKKDGWKNFEGAFKNQGDCVSFVSTGGRNQGSSVTTSPSF